MKKIVGNMNHLHAMKSTPYFECFPFVMTTSSNFPRCVQNLHLVCFDRTCVCRTMRGQLMVLSSARDPFLKIT